MNRKIYTEAAHGALEKGLTPEQMLAGLRTVLTRNGHSSLYTAVLKELVVSLKKDEADTVATIIVAHHDDVQKYADSIAEFVREAHAQSTAVVIDETIVGGFIAKTKTKKYNQSYAESLATIYRSIVSN